MKLKLELQETNINSSSACACRVVTNLKHGNKICIRYVVFCPV